MILLTKYSDEYVDIVEPDLTEKGQHLVHDDPSVQLIQDLINRIRIK
jgi:hypothetical protein